MACPLTLFMVVTHVMMVSQVHVPSIDDQPLQYVKLGFDVTRIFEYNRLLSCCIICVCYNVLYRLLMHVVMLHSFSGQMMSERRLLYPMENQFPYFCSPIRYVEAYDTQCVDLQKGDLHIG